MPLRIRPTLSLLALQIGAVCSIAPQPGILIESPVNNSKNSNTTLAFNFRLLNVEKEHGVMPIVYFNSNNPVPMTNFEKYYTITVNELPPNNYTIKVVLVSIKTRVPIGVESKVKFERVPTTEERALVPRVEPAIPIYDESMRYLIGDGVRRDAATAVQLLQDAAMQGNSMAMLTLGKAYLYAQHGLQLNTTKAVRLLAMSAERGSIFNHFSEHADGERRGLDRIGG